jgi:hypothetical protein
MKGKYLNPKADLTFKKVFGEHPDLVMSLLNALLPLDEGKQIEHVEYLTPEMVPENPGKKGGVQRLPSVFGGYHSIVDVRCRETGGRHFIVEMQMRSNLFACPGKNWNNELYDDPAIKAMPHIDIIEGLRFVFVELPKFKPQTIAERKMAVLWLRFLTEIDRDTEEAPAELLENPDTNKALKILEKSAYDEGQLYAYERFWDAVTTERVNLESHYKKGLAEGKAIAEAKWAAKINEKTFEIARNMKANGLSAEIIAKTTGLTADEITKL